MLCDLHMHSTASDGTDAPGALGGLAAAAGLAAIALTDHDTTAGLAEAAAGCAAAGVAFVPGIEVSADPAAIKFPREGVATSGTLHILGLFIRGDDPVLAAVCRRMEEARNQRNPAIIDRLRALGMAISYDEVLALTRVEGNVIVGRPHIAQVMVARGYAESIDDAFRRFLSPRGAAYVRRDRLHPADAVEAIHHAGGLAVLAHPVQLKCENDDELHHAARALADLGLDAIETRHSDHTPAHVEQYERLAAELNLLTSGGSDYHGTRKRIALGSQRVPLSIYERLREHATTRAAAPALS